MMKLNRPTRKAVRAFTLIEVLLAVGIFAIVLFAINTVFFSALKLERATSRVVDARLPLNQAFAFLQRDLQGAVPPLTNSYLLPRHFTTGGGRSGGLGSSQAGSLEFFTTTGTLSDESPWSDLQKVRYELVPAADRASAKGQDLVRVITRNILAITTEEESEQFLVGDVESVEFLCYNGTDWRNTWDTSAGDVGLPQAVRIRIQLAAENPTAKPSREPLELLVPITTVLLTNSLAGGTP
jgi:type II secretion system protein J